MSSLPPRRHGLARAGAAALGLIPHWAREPKTGYRLINARAETVADKPAYRDAFRQRRCLIPTDGFYEWRPGKPRKQLWFIRRRDGAPFAYAGLWGTGSKRISR